MLSLRQPIDRGEGKLVLEFGSTYIEATPQQGGRITSFRQKGQELLWLRGAQNYADAIGSTFWPSPQNWGWPPPVEIDAGPYRASIEDDAVICLEGARNELTNLKVCKRLRADLVREAVDVEYALTNVGREPAKWAPWEITRVPANGLAFWPTGSAPAGDRPLSTRSGLGHTWCAPAETSGEGKLFADGSGGYLAYAWGDRLLVKQFEDQPPEAVAPGEAEIELYVNPDHSYVELEQQGAYTSIAPGQTVRWSVRWYARQLPPGMSPTPGHADLIAFVEKTLE